MPLLDYDFSAARTEPPSQFVTLTVVLSVLSALTLLWAGVDTRLIAVSYTHLTLPTNREV